MNLHVFISILTINPHLHHNEYLPIGTIMHMFNKQIVTARHHQHKVKHGTEAPRNEGDASNMIVIHAHPLWMSAIGP